MSKISLAEIMRKEFAVKPFDLSLILEIDSNIASDLLLEKNQFSNIQKNIIASHFNLSPEFVECFK